MGLKKFLHKARRVAKPFVKAAVGIAAPVIAQRLASGAIGIVDRKLANRRLKKEKERLVSKALTTQIAVPKLMVTASRETAPSSALPGGAKAPRSSRATKSAFALPGGTRLQPASSSAERALDKLKADVKSGQFFARLRAKDAIASEKAAAVARRRSAAEAKRAAKKQASAHAKAKRDAARRLAKTERDIAAINRRAEKQTLKNERDAAKAREKRLKASPVEKAKGVIASALGAGAVSGTRAGARAVAGKIAKKALGAAVKRSPAGLVASAVVPALLRRKRRSA